MLEKCSKCGKEISRQARANVFEDRCVCTPCHNRLLSRRAAQKRMDDTNARIQEGEDDYLREQMIAWVRSVIRHSRGMKWFSHSECDVPLTRLTEIANVLMKNRAICAWIEGVDEGWDDEFQEEALARGVDEPDLWHVFAPETMNNPNTVAYRATISAMNLQPVSPPPSKTRASFKRTAWPRKEQSP